MSTESDISCRTPRPQETQPRRPGFPHMAQAPACRRSSHGARDARRATAPPPTRRGSACDGRRQGITYGDRRGGTTSCLRPLARTEGSTSRRRDPPGRERRPPTTAKRDLLKAELLSAPVVLLVLVFRSFLDALIPLTVAAAVAALTTLALLRPLAAFMPLSVFSTNLTAALGFGLTVDYCLFLITRYRYEISTGATGEQAVRAAMRTAGRAAGHSSVTIAATMATLLCFPVPVLRSMACAGLVVALCATASSCLLLRPLPTVLGHRLTSPRLRDPWRVGPFWHTTAAPVTKRPALWAGGALLALTVLLLPASHLRPGPPTSASCPRRRRLTPSPTACAPPSPPSGPTT
ncbi:MMPL family transporter [Streptomyces sp. NPDC051207]|uniref:MMPL family transporter n=1 Tax=Streptomyces sp. NPDC051207 TaxID=3154641 RepID=UPI0034215D8D